MTSPPLPFPSWLLLILTTLVTAAEFVMAVNVIGLGISVTVGGYLIDWFEALGRPRPITDMMIVLNVVSLLAIPCLWIAARSYAKDRARLAT